ncbi:MAG: Asp-tRNA(Asn)/Glu-tRNA(Gln) amidotransferase subunit GatA, partial [Calditrichaeota bacterium]|nr:Asp-tRNA(Asn)/Glu-tRNA(Gln) amidotransferase subunit GatA [Calditrichota bacterium]
MSIPELSHLDYQQIRGHLEKGDFSVQELVNAYLEALREKAELNAFINVFGEEALERARQIDERLRQGTAGRLAGLVLGVKDNIVIQGQPTTCGSRMLADFRPVYSATVVRKVLDQDAVVLGKTNMDEFAMGSSNETSYFGPVRNPHDPDRVPGGSSGGSATAVAAGLCTAALGSDTGGSIRQPASFCGVVGLKPTYGRVSRFGLVAFASSLDQIGPIGRSVADVALLTEVISGYDERDSTSVRRDVPEILAGLDAGVKGLRVGLPREYLG